MNVLCTKTIPVPGTDKVYFREGKEYFVIEDKRPDFLELEDEQNMEHIVTDHPEQGLLKYFKVNPDEEPEHN